MGIVVVWLKRDLRLSDHAPLLEAKKTGLPVLLVYCFEPILLNDKHYSGRHWQFILSSLKDIQEQVPKSALICLKGTAVDSLSYLHQHFNIHGLFSHQEVGLDVTYQRDIAVKIWCDQNNIVWHECSYAAVVRGLTHRTDWDKNWKKVMKAPLADSDITAITWANLPENACQLEEISQSLPKEVGNFQQGGEKAARETLQSFFDERGQSYAYNLSSPEFSQQFCSRLSAYLAWGNISVRQVYQEMLTHWAKKGCRRSLVAFSSRLHWHCHFIQKFESECAMENRPVNRGYLTLPWLQGELKDIRLKAWETGNTGVPMVDACMRSLQHTGYLNFRMRAMLVSFLSHHLQVDWRLGVKHLARLFLDFEPGIHYSQFQMQAGVTGINTIRIYNPVKQGEEKDPSGSFVKRWLPALSEVPTPLLHSPWQLSSMEQVMYNINLGVDYPKPIVDIKQSYKEAQALLWSWRNKPSVKVESHRLLNCHVRPSK